MAREAYLAAAGPLTPDIECQHILYAAGLLLVVTDDRDPEGGLDAKRVSMVAVVPAATNV